MPKSQDTIPRKRASLSKRIRFRIFERDLFTCQYCGTRPPETVLQLDHIHPFSEGGEDTEENLVTSCVGCNAGKSNRVLGAIVPRPDADAKYLQMQQEIAEARLYLEAKQERDELYEQLVDGVLVCYETFICKGWRPKRPRILDWLISFGPEEVDFAIRTAGRRADKLEGMDGPTRYITAILANRQREGR